VGNDLTENEQQIN